MHEQSLIRSLLKQVDELRREHGAEHVLEVRVEVGPLSGVEPLLLASAFDQLAPESSATGAKLVIDEVPLLAQCQACDRDFEVHDFIFRCPDCGGNVRVTSGDTLQLVSVTFSEARSGLCDNSDPKEPLNNYFDVLGGWGRNARHEH